MSITARSRQMATLRLLFGVFVTAAPIRGAVSQAVELSAHDVAGLQPVGYPETAHASAVQMGQKRSQPAARRDSVAHRHIGAIVLGAVIGGVSGFVIGGVTARPGNCSACALRASTLNEHFLWGTVIGAASGGTLAWIITRHLSHARTSTSASTAIDRFGIGAGHPRLSGIFRHSPPMSDYITTGPLSVSFSDAPAGKHPSHF